jgi:DNA-binding transcriptional MocR family regulator
MWKPSELSRLVPLYVAIADALEQDVHAGRVRPGDRLPTHRALARSLGVNVMTVTRGYAEAGRRGLVEGEVGRGTFVRGADRAIETFLPLVESGRRLVDFHFNIPASDAALLDPGAWCADLAAQAAGSPIFAGYTPAGLPEHRAVGARWAARFGVKADASRVLVTGGVQHGMTLCLATLTSPGDMVLVEALTYPGMKALASVLHLRLVPVELDRDGLVPAALDAACRRHEARVLYTMPTVHNPTGLVTSEARRRELAELARVHDLTVIEDDTYGWAAAEPPAPLAARVPERTHYLVGTSKSLAAGLRVGFLVAPEGDPAIVDRLCATVAATSWMAAPPMADLAGRWIDDGSAWRMVEWKRREARARAALFAQILGDAHLGAPPTAPHVWCTLPEPWRPECFAREARAAGVAVTPAEAFVTGRAPAPHAVRMALGTPHQREEVERGLRILARVRGRGPSPVPVV